ncbi:MAG TPA: hypothetical protein VE777_10295 [Gaiellales bacterium]|nr:hypothetical protein [Gaiellales bacterium]
MSSAEAPADEVERLYGLDAAEFVAERTAAARRLRKEGRRGEADAVAALRKPSVAAAVVNRLARAEPRLVGELLDAGARLREVQLGAGSGADLRSAAEAEQSALSAVIGSAGRSSAESTLQHVRETLHAAALDPELAELVRRGILDREAQAIGFPMGIAVPPDRAARPKPAPRPRSEPVRRATPAPAKPEPDRRRVAQAERAVEAAEGRLAEAETKLEEAVREERAAKVEVESARKALAGAERQADRLSNATARADRAREAAEERLTQARARLAQLGG